MRITVAQIGARRHYAIPAILERARLLERFYTDLCANVGLLGLAGRMIPSGLQPAGWKRLLARRVEAVPRAKIGCFPRFALQRLRRRAKATGPGDRLRQWAAANERFGQLVVRRGLGDADTVYAFNGAGLELFDHARRHGLRTILEQTDAPVAFEARLLAEERERWPGWEFGGVAADDWQPLAERERGEWERADRIVCGSEYVRDAVAAEAGPAERCAVVPYAAAAGFFRKGLKRRSDGGLRVLFVGSVCLRKGVPYLMEAARLLAADHAPGRTGRSVRPTCVKELPVVFRVVGPVNVSEDAAGQLRRYLELTGSVPRSEMARHYEWADVLVLPSISEGSANVCYEALAAGLPVITTKHAGSVVRDGQEGFLVPLRCAERIAECIRCLADDAELYEQLSRQALARARDFTWERYAERLLSAIGADYVPLK